MLEAIVQGIIDVVTVLACAFFLKSMIQHGIFKGFWRFILLIEGTMYFLWNLYISTLGSVVRLIFRPISWVWKKFVLWSDNHNLSLVLYFGK